MAFDIYTQNNEGKTIKVWAVTYNEYIGRIEMRKIKPHLFGVEGALANLDFKAFATQRHCFVKEGRKKKPYDLLEKFKANPNINIIILDTKAMKRYESTSETWATHGVTKDYGHGEQIFLDIKFMKVIADYSTV